MENSVGTEDRPNTAEARRSVQSWYNPEQLVLVEKSISELKKDALVVKNFNLTKIQDTKLRETQWRDMQKVFNYRFGVEL